MRQKSEQQELALDSRGETPRSQRSGEAPTTPGGNERSGGDHWLMEHMVARANALAALKRVKQNQGSPGGDEMTVDDLSPYLAAHWEAIREQLLAGSYQPQPVKRQEIPKPGGGTRQLGIPTVLDRFIQQCLLQVLQPQYDPTFSDHSYGFRPGRSAHQAVRAAQRYIQSGRRWVADVDLAKSFDRVNHDVLMERAISTQAAKAIRKTIREWQMAYSRSNQRLEDLARLVNPVVRGWMNYYGRFYRSRCVQVLRHLNEALAAWARRKYKRLRRRERASMHWLGRIARRDPNLFVLWQLGIRPEAGG